MLTMLGPGSTWPTDSTSTNCSRAHPALLLDQFALRHRQHAAEALQRQPGERNEEAFAGRTRRSAVSLNGSP
jgi:hypothetical protein